MQMSEIGEILALLVQG